MIEGMFSLLPLFALLAQTPDRPVRAVTDPGIITTRQAITPAGTPSVFQGRVYGIAWDERGENLFVLQAGQLVQLNWRKNEVVLRAAYQGGAGNQSIATTAGKVFIGGSAREGQGPVKAKLMTLEGGSLVPVASGLGSFQPGALAVAKNIVAVPLVWENKLAIVDAASKRVLQQANVGIAPFAAVMDRDAKVAYVSNLGGRLPKPGEETAAPMQKPTEQIVVDQRGIAATGTVTRVDLATGQATHTIPVGLHPTGLLLDEARGRLFVANGNADTVSWINTQTNKVEQTVDLSPVQPKVRGLAPTALALSPDGATLYVALGGLNAVAVVNVKSARTEGMIPTAWYPNHLALSPDGKLLAVSTLLGPGSAWRDAPSKRYVHANRGSVAVIPVPDKAQLASYTTAVAENNHLRLAAVSPRAGGAAVPALPVPERSGDASLIEHVVFIVKENRTYDQVLGDIAKGNSDPSLVMFGRDVTPNQHKIAEEFVLLDNFFATGGNSADGHQWVTQANEVEYCLWPGYQGRSYPFDGTDPMAYSAGGFLWDYALAKGRTVKVYGEYAGRMPEPEGKSRLDLLSRWEKGEDFSQQWKVTAPIAGLNKVLAAHFPSYTNSIPDVIRASIFLKDLAGYEKTGKFPNLTLLQLPSDHTFGASPGSSSPKAMVADNDYAVGLIVEGLTKSKFWPKMAIFIVEDDAQNGVDHVDGHRTTAFVVSPYTRRGHVDSTFYSHQSMLKTIELMLGLPTMSLFDLIANDMRASFTQTPDATPFSALKPTYDLYEVNPQLKALRGPARDAAKASAKMNFLVPDAAPSEKLNRILWGMVRGWATPYPNTPRRAFSPLSLDVEDDDR